MSDIGRLADSELSAIIARNVKLNEFDMTLENVANVTINIQKIRKDIRKALVAPRLVDTDPLAARNQEL